MDEMVYQTQRWLNKTYGNDSRFKKLDLENTAIKGKTGWATIYALTRALQIELGIESTADSFGPSSRRLYAQNPLRRNDGETNNKYGILQGALWCKGYNPGHYYAEDHGFSCVFDERVENAIKALQTDAGVTANGIVSVNLMAALLSMDAFKLLSGYGGKEYVRSFQQMMNGRYESYIGIRPCDGIYGRNTAVALIYAIQAEEKLPVGTANGNFGPATKRCCPTLPYLDAEKDYTGQPYGADDISRFRQLFSFALYVNGYGDGSYTNAWDESSVREFQRFMAIPETGVGDLNTWMAATVSCGNTSRTAKAADCATILTPAKAQTLKDNGYEVIGRYLTGYVGSGVSKALTEEEITIIFNAGLRFFPIYQTSGRNASYFTEKKGTEDAQAAVEAAENLRIPYQTVIYFAVDFDAMDYQITNNVIPYFKAVSEYINGSHKYSVGIYGARNVCTRVSQKGYAVYSFVGDMSTGYSGNLGYLMPSNWAFDQFATVRIGTGDGQLEIDKDAFSGRGRSVQYRVSKVDADAWANSYGAIAVNRSGDDILVYSGCEPLGQIGPQYPKGNPIGRIKHDEFFVYKYLCRSSENCFPVIYTNASGQAAEGYVYKGENNIGGDDVYEKIWRGKDEFMNWKPDATGTKLVSAHAEVLIEGKLPCTVYTLSAPTWAFNSDGSFYREIPEGTKVGISSSTCGATRPYLILVQSIAYQDYGSGEYIWESFGKFIDLRFDLGNKPNNRLLR